MKNKLLILFLSIFSIFIFNNNVYALEFTATDGNTYQVVDDDTFIDYVYYTLMKSRPTIKIFFYKNYNYIGYKYLTTSNVVSYIDNSRLYFKRLSDNSTQTFYGISYNRRDNYSLSSRDNGSTSFSDYSSIFLSNVDIYSNNSLENIYKNADFSSDVIEAKYGVKTYYTITYYLNNEIYNSYEVESGTNYTLIDYIPPEHYSFSGWSYDSNIDITDITESFNIYGTTTYVRPNMNYSENINSPIHDLSIKILGRNIPVEFDFVYTIMDYLILIALIFCILMPFIIVIKLLGGRF